MKILQRMRAMVRVLASARRNRTDFLRAIARRPQLAVGHAVFETAVLFSAKVEPRLKQLAELKVAAIIGCEYCLDIGSALARHEDVTEVQLRELSKHRDSDAFDATERLVLDVADALTRSPASLDDDLRDRFESAFGVAERVELLSIIAWENQRARLNQGLGVRTSGFSDGAYCALPERV
jgi:AhpD family alkylhydroperoxidase